MFEKESRNLNYSHVVHSDIMLLFDVACQLVFVGSWSITPGTVELNSVDFFMLLADVVLILGPVCASV